MNWLAQTTQPRGMANWRPGDWALFFTAFGGFVGAVATAIVKVLLVKINANKRAIQAVAQNTATLNKVADPQSPVTQVPAEQVAKSKEIAGLSDTKAMPAINEIKETP